MRKFALRQFAALRRDRQGTVAITFALTIIPTVLAVGSAVDYTRAATLKSRLQAATDAAALAVGGTIGEKTDAEIRARATTEFLAIMGGEGENAKLDDIEPIVVSEGRTKLTLNSEVTYVPRMIRIPGMERVVMKAQSQTLVSNLDYEIALVFDNSGSMAESAGGKTKMKAAQDAAKRLIDIMYANDASARRTKMALVPFTLSVNVGKQPSGADYSTAGWVDSAGQSPIHWGNNFNRTGSAWQPGSRFDLFTELNVAWAGCMEARPGAYGVNDAPANVADPASLFVPMFAPDEPGDKDKTSYYLSTGTSSGSGTRYTYDNSYLSDLGGSCSGPATPSTDVTKRQAQICKYKINKVASRRTDNGAARGPNRNCDAKPLLRMTNDPLKLKNAVDTMVAAGNTNLVEGFAWGWRTISPNNPFADGRPYSDVDTRKIIILLTDGQNAWNSASNHNKSIWSPFGFYPDKRLSSVDVTSSGQAADEMDKRTLESCTLAKSAGVKVYTVGFSVKSGDVDRVLLEKCATSPSMAYIASNATQIQTVFEEIAASIGTLRLTH